MYKLVSLTGHIHVHVFISEQSPGIYEYTVCVPRRYLSGHESIGRLLKSTGAVEVDVFPFEEHIN